MRRRPESLLVVLVLLGLSLPFLGKPPHIDDPNFLTLARGAAADPWRPHAVVINWQGHAERAFDVLSNPPGVAWLLAPVVDAPVQAQHAVMLLWTPLLVWGALRLGRLVGAGPAVALLIGGCPIAAWAAGALTPDLPLLALTVAGLAGILGRPPSRLEGAWPFALMLGLTAIFRYSGLALLPLAALWPLLHGERRAALALGFAAALPSLLLAGHDLAAYGGLHLLAMVGFQGVSNTGGEIGHKALAALGALGGAGLLPILCWRSPARAALGLALGLALGAWAGQGAGLSGAGVLASALAVGAGLASLVAIARPPRDRLDLLLQIWLVMGGLFLLTLRFTATRYWLPFLPPAVLLSARGARPALLWAAVLPTLGLAALLLVDDARLARAQVDLAEEVIRASGAEEGLFAGHWGFQGRLEAAGWTALEEDATVPPGRLLARSAIAWPQEAGPGCLEKIGTWEAEDRWPGPRVHSALGGANLHAFAVAGDPPIDTFAPWTLADDPLDTVEFWRGCEGESVQ